MKQHLTLAEALATYWAKVDRRGPDECWPWLGATTDRGYGQCGAGEKRCLATHVALAIVGQPRPSKHHLALHSCDNPPCVNPAHLRWGHVIDNVADRKVRGRCNPTGHLRYGEKHPRAKLTIDLVRYVRLSPATTLELAAELGVTNQCISRIRLRQTWQHVE